MNDPFQLAVSVDARKDLIDRMEAHLDTMVPVHMPLTHIFTPGLYGREIFHPAGVISTTIEWAEDCPFVLLAGRALIYSTTEGALEVRAPHTGVTKAGTRRVILALEDVRLITFHPNPENLTDVEELERRFAAPRVNPYIEGGQVDPEKTRYVRGHTPEIPAPRQKELAA